MSKVEVYGEDEKTPLFIGEFAFLPRLGEYISKDAGDNFDYCIFKEIWHRKEGSSGIFQACMRVELSD